jgi:hypothetical protein
VSHCQNPQNVRDISEASKRCGTISHSPFEGVCHALPDGICGEQEGRKSKGFGREPIQSQDFRHHIACPCNPSTFSDESFAHDSATLEYAIWQEGTIDMSGLSSLAIPLQSPFCDSERLFRNRVHNALLSQRVGHGETCACHKPLTSCSVLARCNAITDCKTSNAHSDRFYSFYAPQRPRLSSLAVPPA